MNGKMKDGIVKRGSTWAYTVRVRDAVTGQMKDMWVSAFPSEEDAKRARNEARVQADKGTAVADTRMTVKEYLAGWLDNQASQVRPTTLVSYRLHVDKYIVPHIGHERLQKLSPGPLRRDRLLRSNPERIGAGNATARSGLRKCEVLSLSGPHGGGRG